MSKSESGMKKTGFNSRALAAQVVYRVCHEKRSLSQLLPELTTQCSATDRAFIQEIAFGICRQYYSLSAILRCCMERPLKAEDRIVESILLCGIYQLTQMRTPSHAAINETVEAATVLGKSRHKGLINAILRRISREDFQFDQNSPEVTWNHPSWIIEKLRHNWPDQWQAILTANNQKAPMALRVNQRVGTRDDYLKLLADSDIEARACTLSRNGLVLSHPINVDSLPGFEEGAVSVQDSAAQLCAELMALEPGMRVLDACAAPGGKTAAMLEAESEIDMTALDNDTMRLHRVQENLERLGLQASITCAPAENTDQWWDGKPFQRILLDAPCSATGVIRRHPDIKLLRREQDILRLADQQLSMLSSLWQTLETGGRLVYATCSVFSQENSRIIERFLKSQIDAELISIDARWGLDTGFGRQLFPQTEQQDGFFYSCLRKML